MNGENKNKRKGKYNETKYESNALAFFQACITISIKSYESATVKR